MAISWNTSPSSSSGISWNGAASTPAAPAAAATPATKPDSFLSMAMNGIGTAAKAAGNVVVNAVPGLGEAFSALSTLAPNLGKVGSDIGSYPSDVVSAFKSGIGQAAQGEAQGSTATNPLSLVEGGANIAAGAASALTSPITPIIKGAMDATGATSAIKATTDAISNIPAVQSFANSPAGEATTRAAGDIQNLDTVAGTIAGGEGGLENAPSADSFASLAKAAKPVVADPLGSSMEGAGNLADFAKNIVTKNTGNAETDIVNSYTKAVKPTISGKTTLADTQNYNAKVVNAVNTIAANKDNLSYKLEDGETETGRTPQNLSEFTQAIDQTKQSIYKQYDALASQAGEQGATVKPQAITQGLQDVVNNKALQLSHPEAVKYAQTLMERFNDAGEIDAKTAQSIIENYNAELQSFYRNPTYNQASHVAIDAGLVKNIRSALDETISKSTGTQYQALRNQYASLKTIEGDVNKSANRVARLNNKGLADYTDIFSGGDIVSGILTLNPGLFVKGVAQTGIKSWFKSINSPDRAISNMFDTAQRASSQASSAAKPILPITTPSATAKTAPKNSIR